MIDKTAFDPTSLETCSYEIRVGNLGVVGGSGKELDLNTEVLELPPGGYAGLISWEKFVLPKDICVRLGSKRSYSYDGVILLSGTLVDPGYQGHLLFGVYNASQKKYLLRKGAKICNAVFERLPGEVDRDGAQDAYLIRGKFPHDFINKMANMEVLPWMQISERVKQIERMSAEIVDLRTRYDDVMVPIEKLTENVNLISQDVAKLSDQTAALRTAASENAATASRGDFKIR